jgi:signal transduction histidine kinase
MGPIDLDAVPSAWDLMTLGRAVPIVDAGSSPLIPKAWAERFSLESLVLVPLFAGGEPCGIMAVDHQIPRTFDDDDLRLLEAIGSYAGVAVRNAHNFHSTRRRSELNEELVRIATGLVSPSSRADLLAGLIDSYVRVFGARLCAVGLIDAARTQVKVLASRGTRAFDVLDIDEVPERVQEDLRRAWLEQELFEVDDDPWLRGFVGGEDAGASRYLMIPLTIGAQRGGILLGFGRDVRLDSEERSAASALAAIASAALERSILVDRLSQQLRRLEILHALGAALAEQADAEKLQARLNRLLKDEGIDVAALVFRDRALARRLGGEAPLQVERESWSSKKPFAQLDDGLLSVPMVLGRRIVGAIRVRLADRDESELAFIEALANGIAEVASRGALRADVEEADRERAVAAERGRIAADLHDTAGQLFVAIGLLARRESQHVPADSPWHEKLERLAELADAGKWEISRAIQALAFFPEARRGIAPSLRALGRSLESDSGIETVIDVQGSPRRLTPRVERALYRVAHEALSNAWRHPRCTTVRISLEFAADEVVLKVADDGTGIAKLVGLNGVGISSMRRAMEEVGGALRLRPLKPHGTVVEARVMKEAR